MSSDSVLAELKDANDAFYHAYESLSVRAMESIWAKSDDVLCIHPGWKLLRGTKAVREGWEKIFSNTTFMQFIITEVVVHHYGTIGIVSCVENIMADTKASVPTDYSSMQAVNVYRKVGGEWSMILHHASQFMPV